VIEVTSGDGRSAVVRVPGQVRVTGTEDMVTISSIGRTLLVPLLEAEREAQREAGLPDLALVTGRVDSTLTLDPITGTPIDVDIAITGKVIDACDLLE